MFTKRYDFFCSKVRQNVYIKVPEGRGHVNSDLNCVLLTALPGCQFSLLPSGLLESV